MTTSLAHDSVEKPAAMADATTYAAVRLREIKADPPTWNDVWLWRREFSLADTPELPALEVRRTRPQVRGGFVSCRARAGPRSPTIPFCA
jgi:hypothetical protein